MRWLLTTPDRDILASTEAGDIREARERLSHASLLHPGAWVMSEASYECGDPKPLDPERCHACGIRDHEAGEPYCGRCKRSIQRDRNEAQRMGLAREETDKHPTLRF